MTAARGRTARPVGRWRGSSEVRLRFALIVLAMVISVFGVRLFQLQGLDPKAYAAKADAEGLVTVPLPATRGAITDRNGVALAESVSGLMIVADPVRTDAHAEQIAQILDALEHRHGIPIGRTRLLPIATETPEGLLNIREVAAASPRIVAISWGIEDLGAAMGLPRVRDAHGAYLDIPRYARTMCAVAAAAAGVEALDTVYTDIADLEGLRRECEDGVAMGFSGKISIHPGQITVINEAFTPVAVAAVRGLGLDPDRVNVNGSGCGLGHPIAATGARMVVTMLHELERRGATLGCVSMCAGGGMGSALVVERL